MCPGRKEQWNVCGQLYDNHTYKRTVIMPKGRDRHGTGRSEATVSIVMVCLGRWTTMRWVELHVRGMGLREQLRKNLSLNKLPWTPGPAQVFPGSPSHCLFLSSLNCLWLTVCLPCQIIISTMAGAGSLSCTTLRDVCQMKRGLAHRRHTRTICWRKH